MKYFLWLICALIAFKFNYSISGSHSRNAGYSFDGSYQNDPVLWVAVIITSLEILCLLIVIGFVKWTAKLFRRRSGDFTIQKNSNVYEDEEEVENSQDDLVFYEIIAEEIKSNLMHDGLRLMAFHEAKGDPKKAEYIYIEHRLKQLRDHAYKEQKRQEDETHQEQMSLEDEAWGKRVEMAAKEFRQSNYQSGYERKAKQYESNKKIGIWLIWFIIIYLFFAFSLWLAEDFNENSMVSHQKLSALECKSYAQNKFKDLYDLYSCEASGFLITTNGKRTDSINVPVLKKNYDLGAALEKTNIWFIEKGKKQDKSNAIHIHLVNSEKEKIDWLYTGYKSGVCEGGGNYTSFDYISLDSPLEPEGYTVLNYEISSDKIPLEEGCLVVIMAGSF